MQTSSENRRKLIAGAKRKRKTESTPATSKHGKQPVSCGPMNSGSITSPIRATARCPSYNIAYLCMRDLRLVTKDGERLLPRGKFLFMGGDTADYVADYQTLARRFQATLPRRKHNKCFGSETGCDRQGSHSTAHNALTVRGVVALKLHPKLPKLCNAQPSKLGVTSSTLRSTFFQLSEPAYPV